MPRAEQLIEYHIVTSGSCWARLTHPAEDAVRLEPGSVVAFPRGDRHIMSSRPDMQGETDLSIFDNPDGLEPPFYLRQLGKGPEETRVICGFIGCDRSPFNPVMEALPRMIHIPRGYACGDDWLSNLVDAVLRECRQRRPGSQSVLSRLSELLFIEVIRCYAEALPEGSTGWLAALRDPGLARAIQLLHREPSHNWTLDELAKSAGVSKTALVERFNTHTGMAPMTYLSQWRMQLAARLLAEGKTTIAGIACDVGYESEAAFSRSFKRFTGLSPGLWRSRRAEPAPI